MSGSKKTDRLERLKAARKKIEYDISLFDSYANKKRKKMPKLDKVIRKLDGDNV